MQQAAQPQATIRDLQLVVGTGGGQHWGSMSAEACACVAAGWRGGGAVCLPSAHSTLAPRSVCAMASCFEARGKPYSCCRRPEMYRPEKQPKRT